MLGSRATSSSFGDLSDQNTSFCTTTDPMSHDKCHLLTPSRATSDQNGVFIVRLSLLCRIRFQYFYDKSPQSCDKPTWETTSRTISTLLSGPVVRPEVLCRNCVRQLTMILTTMIIQSHDNVWKKCLSRTTSQKQWYLSHDRECHSRLSGHIPHDNQSKQETCRTTNSYIVVIHYHFPATND